LQDYIMKNTELGEDVTVYRKVGDQYADILKSMMFPGAVFEDKGFSSTSVHPDTWHGSVHFQIAVKKGAKGLPTGYGLSSNPSEHEIILPAKSKFRVLKIVKGEHANGSKDPNVTKAWLELLHDFEE